MTSRDLAVVPWQRAVPEVVIIVLGILIALAAEAGWDHRVERREEREALLRLRDDFDRSAELLTVTETNHQDQRAAGVAMIRVIADAGDPPGSYQIPDSIIWGIYGATYFKPPRGAVRSLINSGEIGLIQNDELRGELTAWLDFVEVLNVEENEDRKLYEELQLPLVFQFVPYITVGSRLGAQDWAESSAFEANYRALLGSLAFENIMDWRVFNKDEVLAEYDNVRLRIERIRSLITNELGDPNPDG